MPDTPLNPDGVLAATEAIYALPLGIGRIMAERYAQQSVAAYLAVAQPEVNSVDPQERYLCVCGKFITLTKTGVFRHHRGNEKDYPGSPWNKVCVGVGVKP